MEDVVGQNQYYDTDFQEIYNEQNFVNAAVDDKVLLLLLLQILGLQLIMTKMKTIIIIKVGIAIAKKLR